MSHKTNLKTNLFNNRDSILSLAQKYGVRNIKVFGSVSRGQETNISDIDLLIEMDEERSLLEFVAFQQAVEDLLKCKIDLAEPNTLHPLFKAQILEEAIAL
ncbi:MAG: hypothetical protein AUK48_16160 [Oscillatoriales cyanobacterium CG2_30_44_21]|nr:MAG: hypothetical protein AUK48_16160 [Oscillatoriales cyanobacterium CG2_30_44_21]